MSGTRTLVYKGDAVDSMQQDLDTLRTDLLTRLDTLFASVDQDLTGWSEATVSRQAERQYQQDLKESLTTALDALQTLSSRLHEAGELADTAETRNIAVLA